MSAVSGASRAAGGAGLGTSGNDIPHPGTEPACDRSLVRYRKRDDLAEMLRALDHDDALRSMRLCGLGAIPGPDGEPAMVRIEKDPVTGRVAAANTTSCGNVRGCPVCAPRVLRARAEQIGDLLRRAQAARMPLVFLTATLKHSKDQGPGQQKAAITGAWKAIMQGGAHQRRRERGLVGAVRSIEIQMLGPAGPHTHAHGIVAFQAGTDALEVASMMRSMAGTWQDQAERRMDGLRPSDAHGFKWEIIEGDVVDVAAYATKVVDDEPTWSVADELTRSDLKDSAMGSVSLLQLGPLAVQAIRDDGDPWLFRQWMRAMRETRGMRSVTVSKGLREALELVDVDDQAIADAPETLEGWVPIAAFRPYVWTAIGRRWGVAGALQMLRDHGELAVPMLLDGLQLVQEKRQLPPS